MEELREELHKTLERMQQQEESFRQWKENSFLSADVQKTQLRDALDDLCKTISALQGAHRLADGVQQVGLMRMI